MVNEVHPEIKVEKELFLAMDLSVFPIKGIEESKVLEEEMVHLVMMDCLE
jgi:hypothetical protein